MILSKISVCKFNATSPTLKFKAVVIFTEVAISAPTTLKPMIDAASVNTVRRFPKFVINFVPELSVEENEETMLREIKNVKTGQVTYAVRDTVIDDKEIKKDDFMDPMIVGHNTHTRVSPTPANGPIKLVFKD